MRDDQVRRYARHLQLPDIGGLGQTAVLVAVARLPRREAEPPAEVVGGTFLAASGVGTAVVPGASEAELAELAAHAADSRVVTEGEGGKELVLVPRPAWWPAADGDDVALAFWRGGIAATRWLVDAASR